MLRRKASNASPSYPGFRGGVGTWCDTTVTCAATSRLTYAATSRLWTIALKETLQKHQLDCTSIHATGRNNRLIQLAPTSSAVSTGSDVSHQAVEFDYVIRAVKAELLFFHQTKYVRFKTATRISNFAAKPHLTFKPGKSAKASKHQTAGCAIMFLLHLFHRNRCCPR